MKFIWLVLLGVSAFRTRDFEEDAPQGKAWDEKNSFNFCQDLVRPFRSVSADQFWKRLVDDPDESVLYKRSLKHSGNWLSKIG